MGDVNSRQGDLADQASGNNEVHIQLKLKQTDAKILQAIEEALQRIEAARSARRSVIGSTTTLLPTLTRE